MSQVCPPIAESEGGDAEEDNDDEDNEVLNVAPALP